MQSEMTAAYETGLPADLARLAPCGLALLDADYRLLWVNDYLATLFDVPSGPHDGSLKLPRFFTPASRIFLQTRLQQELAAGGQVEELALDLVSGGDRIPVMLNATMQTGDGQPARIRLVISRAPVRRAYEAEVPKARMAACAEREAARAVIATFVRHSPVPLVMTDTDLAVTGVSQAWEAAYGQSAESIIGSRIDSRRGRLREADPLWPAVYRRALAGESLRGEGPVRSAFSENWFEWAVTPWRDAAGEVGGLLLMNFDVTDLIRARDAAAAADEAKTRFLANMSHELRTPLNSVLAPVELLKSFDLPPQARAHLESVEIAGAQLAGLLTNLLDFSQIEAGLFEIQMEPVDLRALCDEVLTACRARVGGRAITVSGPEDFGSRAIVSDGDALGRILTQILSNAVKFTSVGEVALGVVFEPDTVVFTVSDTGSGFDDAAFETLLRPFHQLDASSTRRFGGVGLGLALAQSLTEALEGRLSATSEPGVGSRVDLRVPLRWGGALPAHLQIEDLEPEALRILAVDDNPANLAVLGAILQALDAEVAYAVDGAQAVGQALAARFDLILMDVQMPVMDGLSAIRAIRTHETATGGRTPILVVSANVSRPEVSAAIAAGADEVLAKPIQAVTLIQAMTRVLQSGTAVA